jgi:hypothetical protein
MRCLADFKVEEYYLLPSISAENDFIMSASERFLNGFTVDFNSPEKIVLPNKENVMKFEIVLEKGYAYSNGEEFSEGTHEFQKSAIVVFYQGCKARLVTYLN